MRYNLKMKYEVDQSGRIEETNRLTIISIANNDYSYSVKIDSKIKKLLQDKFKRLGKPIIENPGNPFLKTFTSTSMRLG